MNTTRTAKVVGVAFLAALAAGLTGCENNPSRNACSPPQGPDLGRAISAARLDLTSGCEARFDSYFQQLLSIAEGDPKKDNKAQFSEFLMWANEQGLLSRAQAREIYNRYFGVKYVSLLSDYSVCSQTCPRQTEVMGNMRRELADKEQGLLKVSADPLAFHRANRLFQETELVLEATCEACGPGE